MAWNRDIFTFTFYYFNVLASGIFCGFPYNRTNAEQIGCIHEMLEKIWNYSGTLQHLFTDFVKACD
jgi:hypothetical protein